jgi:hypothetical protein
MIDWMVKEPEMLPAHLDPYELASLEQERLTGTPLPADG